MGDTESPNVDNDDNEKMQQIKQEVLEDNKKIAIKVNSEQCPNCKKPFKLLLNHIEKHRICSKLIKKETVNAIRKSVEEKSKDKENIRLRVEKHRRKNRELNEDKFKEDERLA